MPSSFLPTPSDPNPIGRRVHSQQRVVGANTVEVQYTIPTSENVISTRTVAGSFRITASGASPHNLFTLENTAGSTVLVAVKELIVEVQVTALTANLVAADLRLFRSTVVPTGGTAMTKHKLDTNEALSVANVVARAAASADGVASAITYAMPATTPMWSQAIDKILTGASQWMTDDLKMIPDDSEVTPLVLRAGESILVTAVGIVPAHYAYTVRTAFDEYTTP